MRSSASHYIRAVGAGLAVGLAGLWLPQVMGAGYGVIDNAMRNEFPWDMLLVLGLVKMLVTLFCFSAGTPGGMFAPALFTGAMIGGGLGALAARWWPFPVGAPSAYVLVGMGVFFAGVFRAPMTSIFMVFEVSASYVIILPVMIANTIAYLVSRRFQRVPFFTMLARQEGLHLPSLEERREIVSLRVEDAMSTPPEQVLTAASTLSDAVEQISGNAPALVLTDAGDWSCVEPQQLAQALQAGHADRPICEVVDLTPLPRLFPDLTLDAALRALKSHAVLPVLRRVEPFDLVGTVTLEDIHRAYGIAPQAEKAMVRQ